MLVFIEYRLITTIIIIFDIYKKKIVYFTLKSCYVLVLVVSFYNAINYVLFQEYIN